jgi:polar amino acid transport system substrate-binding protein
MQVGALGTVLLLTICGCAMHRGAERRAPVVSAERVVVPSGAPLRVGVAPSYPPVAFKRGAEIVGVEVDLARGLGRDLVRSVQFVELPWERLIPALHQGHIDIIMSGMSITTYRQAHVSFVDPYMQTSQMAIIRVEDTVRFGRPEALYNTAGRVGFMTGTTGELFARARLPDAKLKPFTDVDGGIRALRSGQIDFFVHDAPTVWRLTADPSERELIGLHWPLTQEHVAWAVRKSDVALRRQLNAIVARWKKEGRLETILNRWIGLRIEIRQGERVAH